MVAVPLKVLVGIGGFPVYRCNKGIVGSQGNKGIQEGYGFIVFGISIANCKLGSLEFMCWTYWWLCSACWMTKVSPTCLNQGLGGWRVELMALDSNSSMMRLAIRGLMGKPKAAPWTCSKY